MLERFLNDEKWEEKKIKIKKNNTELRIQVHLSLKIKEVKLELIFKCTPQMN